MTITLYDIPSTNPGNIWSPNTFKTRYTLNFKGLPYKTEWIEYPDIEQESKKLGIAPTSKKADGSDLYTLPAIHDPSTGTYIADSILIAEYLEKTYPDTPRVFPGNTTALQVAFVEAFRGELKALWEFHVPAASLKLNPRSVEFHRRRREAAGSKSLGDAIPKGEAADIEWAKVKAGFANIDGWYAKNGGKGPFLLGEKPSWGDLVFSSYLVSFRIVWGTDTPQWRDISSWNNGRWGGIVEALKEYETVV